ncbi:MAG: glycosyltransferase [Lentisphaerota bacterium]
MRMLVIEHTSWIEMMCHAWRMCGVEVVYMHLQAPSMTSNEEARFQGARSILQAVADVDPDFIVDINGVGVLPLDESGANWTTERVDVPWCEWWWNAPHHCSFPLHRTEESAAYVRALRHESVLHFFWDAVVGREYQAWLARPCFHLPTATHTGLFHPDAIAACDRYYPPVELAFLGAYYPLPRKSELSKIHELARFCLHHREDTYFDVARPGQGSFEAFKKALDKSLQSAEGPFHPDVLRWKTVLDQIVGYERRTVYLHRILEEVQRSCFAGAGWPDVFSPQEALYQPAHVVTRYQTSLFCPDFSNAQQFTGTTMRCYEIMASGGVLLCGRFPDFDPTGEWEDKIYLAYSTPDECMEKIREYRSDSRLLQALRDNARAFVVERHTWSHRLSDLIKALTCWAPSTKQEVAAAT